jgi:putative oxidoreductase
MPLPVTRVSAFRSFVLKVAAALDWLPLTLARLALGWIFVESGWGKLHNLPRVIEFFASLGIPAPEIQAPFAAGTELVCGALLLAGLFTRVAAVPLVVTMTVAILTAKRGDISSFSDLFGMSEFLYIILLGTLSAFGAGTLSLDRLLVRVLERPASALESAGPLPQNS